MFDLALLNQISYRAGDFFDWHVRVDAMLIKEIDAVSLQSLQRRLRNFLHMLRPAISTNLLAALAESKTELRCNYNFIAKGSDRLADHFFVRERPVSFGGIEEGDAAFERRANEFDCFLFISGRSIAVAQTHTAQSQC